MSVHYAEHDAVTQRDEILRRTAHLQRKTGPH
jgi:hypothetical protein